MTSLNYAYFAGLFDGEGTVTLTKDRATSLFRKPVLAVPSTSYELVEAVHTEFGGRIATKRTYKEGHSPSWTWSVTNRKALEVLEKIRPFMREKKKQDRADLLLKNYVRLTPRHGQYTEEMRLAKERFEKEFFSF